jgi:endonuclease YncB( thermonuclease family)
MKTSIRLVAIALTSLSLAPLAAFAGAARVVDGDTLEVGGEKFRLHGIDAPEKAQTCKAAAGRDWACGQAAVAKMRALVGGKDVRCDRRDVDTYGRTIGVCTVDGMDINAAMVSAGLAWAFRRYSNDYVGLEDDARARGFGIWQADTEAAWDYRAGGAATGPVASVSAETGCQIKGNISKQGHIYHMPGSKAYSNTRIDPTQGERWFCSEAEALSAGWRAARSPN